LPVPAAPTNEISLMDIIHILKKYKKLFFGIVLIVTLLGILFAVRQEKQYVFTQPLYLGSYVQADTADGQSSAQSFFEPVSNVIDIFQNYYIPQWIQTYNDTHPSNKISFKYTFNSDANTNDGILYLTTTTTMKSMPILQTLNEFILQQVTQNEAPLLASYIENANSNINILKAEIPSLESSQSIFNISNSNNSKAMPTSQNNVLMDIYLASLSQQQTTLQKELITLKMQLAQYQQSLASVKTASLGQMSMVKDQGQISKASIVLVAFFLGLMLAFFLVIIVNFFKNGMSEK